MADEVKDHLIKIKHSLHAQLALKSAVSTVPVTLEQDDAITLIALIDTILRWDYDLSQI